MQDQIDWNDVWKEQYQRRAESNFDADCAGVWNKRDAAMRFWKMSQENGSRIKMTIEGLPITTESKVLDIGAGPGTLAIPIAKKVARVTAVEPSKGMVSVLKDQSRKEGVKNISCVQKRWEDVDPKNDLEGPYDVVFASYSLGMRDIKDAIEKMIDASSKYVCLYWFAGISPWEKSYQDLWPNLHGSEYYPGPKCDVIYNLLYQMGIYPNVETFQIDHANRFNTFDEAMEHFKPQYHVKTAKQEAILRKFLESSLQEDGETLTFPAKSTRVKIWWEK